MAAEAIDAGKRAEVLRRRAGDGGELLEGPVCQGGRLARGIAQGEHLVGDGLGPEVHGLDAALFGAEPTCAGRLIERLNGVEPFIWRSCGPLAVGRVRRHR